MKNARAQGICSDKVSVYFHPEITLLEAAAAARSLGCCLAWRGNQFVLRRVRFEARRHKQSRQRWLSGSRPSQ